MRIRIMALGVAMLAALAGLGTANAATPVTVYKSPTCGCCDKGAAHAEKSGSTKQQTKAEPQPSVATKGITETQN